MEPIAKTGTKPLKRMLRMLEYVGTDDFIAASINRRQIKGAFTTANGSIREAILGDTPEILLEAEVAAIELRRAEHDL